jgi:hypothetical protein
MLTHPSATMLLDGEGAVVLCLKSALSFYPLLFPDLQEHKTELGERSNNMPEVPLTKIVIQ